jgi:RNA polymerase sigma factor (sigma-70 family)
MRTEDGYIIRQCLDGEKEAFGFLVDKYRESIYAFAYAKLLNFHDAEDITQEAFIIAYRKLHTLKRWDSFLAWLYSITYNECKKLLKKRSNRPDGEFIAEQNASSFDYLSLTSYQEEQVRESLLEALASLPEIYLQVLTLYYLGGMSNREIARFLGTSPNNIDQRLSRGRAKLKKEMLDMMSTTFEQQRLQPGFTFRIVEMVKRIKIKPAPRSTPLLPFGLSAATGVVLTVLMFSSHLIPLTLLGALLHSPMPSKTTAIPVGELPVDVLEISEITFLPSQQGDSKDGKPKLSKPQNAFAPLLAPQTDKTNQSTIIGKDGAEMILIPPGEFKMGSEAELVVRSDTEKPVHTVYLAPFYMDVYEVTNAHYANFLNQYGKNKDTAGHQLLNVDSPTCWIEKVGKTYKPKSGYENHPVNQVSWYGAAEYAKFYGKRLPQEAEWEKAARSP